MIAKPQISAADAADLVTSGDKLMVGGFGMTGKPVALIDALADKTHIKDLTYIANNVGEPGLGGGKLLRNGQLKRAIGSFFSSNPEVVKAAQAGEIDTQLIPQGTLAEAVRAGGAGIGGFYTPTSANTPLEEGRDVRVLGGVQQVFQEALTGDVAFIRAWAADKAGNLVYRLTEQNFNPAMATAAQLVVAEVENIVEVGALKPEDVHTPGCYVDYLVQAPLSIQALGSSGSVAASSKQVSDSRMAMAKAALAEVRPGDVVNLGIGIPTLVADLIDESHGVVLHSENGMLGVGPEPASGGALEHPVNAGKIPVTELPGSSYFDSSASFGMIRGGHVDVAIMGGLQVDQEGNLANWAVPNRPLLGVGGAMDLAVGAKKLVVTMTHVDKDGNSKCVDQCALPLTALAAVDVLITDLAVFQFSSGRPVLTALMPGATVEQVRLNTDFPFETGL